MNDTKLFKVEYYAQKLNRLFWYGIILAVPTELAIIELQSGVEHEVFAIFHYALLITVIVVVPLLGIAGIALAVWARFTSGYRYRMSGHF